MKKDYPARTLKWLAEKTGIQAPYLTNVLKEKAHLSADQLFAVLEHFDWDDDQREYTQLLLEWERSGQPKRKQELKRRLDKIRKEKLQSKAHIQQDVVGLTSDEFTRFYLNPYYSLIHAFMGVGKFAAKPARIARCLNLDGKQVTQFLKELVSLNFLAPAGTGYQKSKRNFHLPKESPFCDPHLALMQQAAAQHLQSLPPEERYGFTAMIAADPEVREKIHREFLAFLKKIEPLVKAAPSEELYGLRFDLFRWSYEKDAP